LIDSIISQQLSVKAAASIERRFPGTALQARCRNAEAILAKSIEELAAAG